MMNIRVHRVYTYVYINTDVMFILNACILYNEYDVCIYMYI